MFLMSSQKQYQSVKSVWWEEDEQGVAVCLIDQSLLPLDVRYLKLRHEQEVAEAIRSLRVRGAPAIGVIAAFGTVCPSLAFYMNKGCCRPRRGSTAYEGRW